MTMITKKKLSPAQQRLLQDMVGAELVKTPQGWFAKSFRAHPTETRLKLMEYGLIQPVSSGTRHAMELTEAGFQMAVGGDAP